MKKNNFVRTTILAASLVLQLSALCFHSRGAAGDVDLSFDPGSGLNGRVNAVVLQPDGKVLIGGEFTMVKGLLRYKVARLNADGSGDAAFDVDPNSGIASVYTLALQPDGKVLVGFAEGIARLNADGSKDTNFIHPSILDYNFIAVGVSAIAVQTDGKILIGGDFSIVNGALRERIARLNADGSLDNTFNPGSGLQGNYIAASSIVVQPDGRVLIGGTFIGYDGTYRTNIARVNSDGTLDGTFDPGSGFNGEVRSIILQPDARLLIGGAFNHTGRKSIARLNADGTLDSSFDPGTGLDGGYAFSLALQSDGKILVGGYFLSVNGTPRNRVARLNADGTLDSSFDRGAGPPLDVLALAAQPDGKVLIGGAYIIGDGSSYNLLTRVNGDGSLDGTFTAGAGIEGGVYSLQLQPDGKALIGGGFHFINGVSRNGIARLNANGSLDSSFDPGTGADRSVDAIALQPDGKLLIGGNFASNTGPLGNGIARLHADGSLDSAFNPELGEGSSVGVIALQSDGKALIAGGFSRFGDPDNLTLALARLNADGSFDSTFDPLQGSVYSVAIQPGDKVLVGGHFYLRDGTDINGIGRLNANGSLDSTFQFGLVGLVYSIALQADGKIFIGGPFGTPDRPAYPYWIARLEANGSVDSSFHPTRAFDPGPGVLGADAITLQPDGKVLSAGDYYLGRDDTGNDRYIQGIYRLNSDGTLDGSFDAGVGSQPSILAIALQPDGNVVIAGYFLIVDEALRPHVARLSGDSPAPSLSIARVNASVVLSWPVSALTYQLKQTINISLANSWPAVAQPPVTNGNRISVTVPATETHKFFRLSSQ